MPDLTTKIDHLCASVDDSNRRLRRLEELIQGSIEHPGFIVRVDRLERAYRAMLFVLGTTYGAGIAAAAQYWWPT